MLGGLGGVAAVGGCSALVEYDVLPGRSRAYTLLGLKGDKAGVPQAEAGPRVKGRFRSKARGTSVGWSVAYPPGSRTDAALPVVVALHAGHGNHETVFNGGLYMDRFLALAVADGVPPFAIAAVDGADGWRGYPDGTGAGATVVDEFVPMLESAVSTSIGSRCSAGRWAGTAPSCSARPQAGGPRGGGHEPCAGRGWQRARVRRVPDARGVRRDPAPHRHRPWRRVLPGGDGLRGRRGPPPRRQGHARFAHPRLLASGGAGADAVAR